MICVFRILRNLLPHTEYVLPFVRHACVCVCCVLCVYSFLYIMCNGKVCQCYPTETDEFLFRSFLSYWYLFLFPSHSYAVIAYGCASCPKLTCEREGCQTEFCYHCKQIWHPNQTCDMARQQRAQTLRVRTKHTSGLSYGQESGPGIIWHCLIFVFIWYFIMWA